MSSHPAGHRWNLAGCFILAALLRWPSSVGAQPILPQEPPEPAVPLMILNAQNSEGPPLSAVPPATPFQFGDWVLRPHLMYSYLDDQGLLSAPGDHQSSIVQTIAPGLLANVGQNWSFNYTPSWIRYSNSVFHDGVDQYADVVGVFTPASWLMQVEQTVSLTSDPESETGMQTDERTYATSLSISKALTSRLAVNASFAQQYSVASIVYPESWNWSGGGGLQYQWSPQVTFSLSANAGFFEVIHSTDGYFLSPLAGVSLRTPDRTLQLNANAGVKQQVYYQRMAAAKTNAPQLHVDGTFAPWRDTTFALNGDVAETFSFLTVEGTRRTDWGANFDQRFLTHLDFAVRAMRSEEDYQSAGGETILASDAGRRDQVDLVNVSFGVTGLLKRGAAKFIYELSRNRSNVAGYSYSSSQLGFQLSYTY